MFSASGNNCQPTAFSSVSALLRVMAINCASWFCSINRDICSQFSSGKILQVAYSKVPPGLSSDQILSRICCCNTTNFSISSALRNHFISGWRRITPVPEQGASSSMRSNCSPDHHSLVAASAAITVSC